MSSNSIIKNYKYMFVILNYNSFQDTLKAVTSIFHYCSDNFLVCVADNNSSDRIELDELKKLNHDNLHLVYLDHNYGYAKGNNQAVKYMANRFSFEYVIIMNPDVTISEESKIEDMIAFIEESGSDNIIGCQPLVWNTYDRKEPRLQTNISNIQYFSDLVLSSFVLFRFIFKKRWRKLVYFHERPYNTEIEFLVPSGAFFIIKYSVFKDIGFFDERTFLYNEELILGYKLYEKNYRMIFIPNKIVQHNHILEKRGQYKRTYKRLKLEISGKLIYMNEYMKLNKTKQFIVVFLLYIDFFVRKIASLFHF